MGLDAPRSYNSGAGDHQTVDVAIIGAGIAGTYAAWRLKEAHPNERIVIFEYSRRVGGRLYSKTLPGMPHLQAELGGMRFIPETQKLVAGLVAHLGLPTCDFPMWGPLGPGNNIMYLRGRLLRVRDLQDSTKVPYNVHPSERNQNPDQLQEYVKDSLFPRSKTMSAADWHYAVVFDRVRLYKLGFWNLLFRMLSSEAYQLMKDGGGYSSNAADSNAAAALQTEEFLPEVKYKTLSKGYDQLPITLKERFAGMAGDYRDNHRLVSVMRVSDGTYELQFDRTTTDDCGRTRNVVPRERCRVRAQKVVLAIPRQPLELITFEGFPDVRWLMRNVRSVVAQDAVKIFLGYEYPWWHALGLWAGRSITDMPIRQTYYFGTEAEHVNEGADPRNLNSLLMVSYNDLDAVPFWKALEKDDPFPGRKGNRFVSGDAVEPHEHMATRAMVHTAREQVAEVHGLKFVPKPYSALYQDWSEYPFGGGWHAWKAGIPFWRAIKRMRRPIRNENVFVCGEAYSGTQAWVEGALQTTERILEDCFSLPRPAWLAHDCDLGL